MAPLTAIWNQIVMLATSTDVTLLIIGAFIILGAGLLTPRPSLLTTSTLLALITFGLANYATQVGMGSSAGDVASDSWQKFLALPVLSILAYAIVFGVLIAVVHGVRKLIFLR